VTTPTPSKETPSTQSTAPPTTPPCQNKTTWSPWINNQTPGSTSVGEFEKMTESQKKTFCPNGIINGVECQTVDGQPWFDTAQIVTCDIRDGLQCDNSMNFGDMCKDYRIRYQCQVICNGEYIDEQEREEKSIVEIMQGSFLS
jgi:hypothetical protein